jgi:C4-dicarboxylate-specific signal transduction histidine kinase
MLTRVSKTVTRIAVIVQGLRTFSRDASNDKFSSASLSEVIHSTLSLCQEKFRSKDIAVSIDIDPPNLTALCQQVQISQVLLNLLNNSCDAILPLQDKWIKISATVGGLGVRLSVTDSGNGIKKEIDDKIFNPFFTTKEVGKGTGLGLSISRGIMEAHHGKISLNPKCANTCFVIELPQGETQEKLVGRMA